MSHPAPGGTSRFGKPVYVRPGFIWENTVILLGQ